jgi:hypothetical protein
MDYDEALNKYFKLKAKYDSEYNKKKHSIITDDELSTKEKRREVQNIKMKCIGCKRAVGTLFSDEDRTYSAICGDSTKPCGLDISIKKGTIINAQDAYRTELQDQNKIKNAIIATKLNLLFGLIDDATMMTQFEELKQTHTTNAEFISLLQNVLTQNLDERKQQVRENTLEYYGVLEQHNELVNEYLKTSSVEQLRDATELYIEELLPLVRSISDAKYQFRDVEQCFYDENKMCVRQVEQIIEHYETLLEEPNVESFKLK